MKLTKFQLNKSREQHLDAVTEAPQEPQKIRRHCPACGEFTNHKRYVRSGMEELVCPCGHVQVYTIR